MSKIQDQVNAALNEIRPFLNTDGGDIELVDIIKDKIVKVRMLGNCTDCSINQMTLKMGVEQTIKKHAPQVEQVINIL